MKRKKIIDLVKLYNSHKATCCKCGCELRADDPLGSVFVLDWFGRFYCMNHDGKFEENDERIFEAEFFPLIEVQLTEEGEESRTVYVFGEEDDIRYELDGPHYPTSDNNLIDTIIDDLKEEFEVYTEEEVKGMEVKSVIFW